MKPGKKRNSKAIGKKLVAEQFSDQEWKSFQTDDSLPGEKSEEMQKHILQHIADSSVKRALRKVTILRITKYAAAAVIILVAGLVFYFGESKTSIVTSQASTNGSPFSVQPEVISPWEKVSNPKTLPISYQLPDSSLVTIYPESSIRFQKKFDQNLRDIYLTGKAKFKVKHDTTRPFSVYAGALKTTALGTSFTINTNLRKSGVTVKLHTGKIVVTNTVIKQNPTYISQVGTLLIYDNQMASVKLVNEVRPVTVPARLLAREGNVITMKNIPLQKVIDLLQEAYHVQVTADSKEISKITFTGTVDVSKEKAEKVLQMIALINNMTVIQTNTNEFKIEITKQ